MNQQLVEQVQQAFTLRVQCEQEMKSIWHDDGVRFLSYEELQELKIRYKKSCQYPQDAVSYLLSRENLVGAQRVRGVLNFRKQEYWAAYEQLNRAMPPEICTQILDMRFKERHEKYDAREDYLYCRVCQRVWDQCRCQHPVLVQKQLTPKKQQEFNYVYPDQAYAEPSDFRTPYYAIGYFESDASSGDSFS